MRNFGFMLVVGLLATGGIARPAAAIGSYHKQFVKFYNLDVGKEANPETELALLVNDRKTKCLVCHQGKKKKHCNPYGKQFIGLLDKKKDKKDFEKIIASFKAVEGTRSDPEDENSPTYGELLTAGKLPGGTLEELQQEPAAEEESEEDGEADQETQD